MQDNKYCVYLHRRKDNNEVFYVGSGSMIRPHGKNSRNSEWLHIVENFGYNVEIVKENLDKLESIEYERYYISLFDNLVNKVLPREPVKLNFEYFNKYVYYDETSPTCLRWKIERVFGANKRVRKVGDTAGNISFTKSARKLTIDGKSYALHRIVWLLNNGSFDNTMVIDHIDGDCNNNQISNLRLITQKQNMRNKAASGKSLVVGVNLIFNRQGLEQSWRAQFVDISGKNTVKYFSISKYGKEEAFRLACQWRKEQIEQLNANGAGYTDRHGT